MGVLIVLGIYLRERGSPELKPVAASTRHDGEIAELERVQIFGAAKGEWPPAPSTPSARPAPCPEAYQVVTVQRMPIRV